MTNSWWSAKEANYGRQPKSLHKVNRYLADRLMVRDLVVEQKRAIRQKGIRGGGGRKNRVKRARRHVGAIGQSI